MKIKITAILSLFVGLLGVGVLLYVFWPIVYYEISSKDRFNSFLSPIPDGYGLAQTKIDYTKASNWIIGEDRKKFNQSRISFYNISISKLKINSATVALGSDDLSKSLVQYPGTALPGKRGTTLIFGHSILPQFYNPKNYMSIFSTLPTLKIGDEIKLNYDGADYRYLVYEMLEVKPSETKTILNQKTDNSYLTLVTCTPPGHPLKPKRLLVRAKIVPLENVSLRN